MSRLRLGLVLQVENCVFVPWMLACTEVMQCSDVCHPAPLIQQAILWHILSHSCIRATTTPSIHATRSRHTSFGCDSSTQWSASYSFIVMSCALNASPPKSAYPAAGRHR